MVSTSLKSLPSETDASIAPVKSTQSSGSRLTHPLASVPNPIAEEKSDAFRKVLEDHRGESQLVILQDFPDPDALSSAWAYQLIAKQFDIQCEILYAGTLSHQENIALVKLTNLPVQRWACQSPKIKKISLDITVASSSTIKAQPVS